MFTLRRSLIPVAALLLAAAPLAAPAAEATFTAHLNAAGQVPEPTKSTGEATLELKVSADGKEIEYVMTVTKAMANISDGDIHLGPADANGPLVVKLFPKHGVTAKKGEFTGVLAKGTFTAADLIGSMAGSSLSDFIDELKVGNVYTNIHTNNGVPGAPPGPGNFRLGEIRGQLKK